MNNTTDKEAQHYIPQFLLRKFSINENLKQIGVFIEHKNKFVTSTSLSSQAQKSYFYGKDGKVEDWLGSIENKIAPVIQDIITTKLLPFIAFISTS